MFFSRRLPLTPIESVVYLVVSMPAVVPIWVRRVKYQGLAAQAASPLLLAGFR